MELVDHDPAAARRLGIPQSVGRDFVQADKAAGKHFAGARHMDGIRQHKRMAMGESIGADSGFESLHGKHHKHMDRDNGTDHRTGGDGERSARPPIEHSKGKHPATAHSDHGPHHSY
jgi:hypothetical protein